MRARTVAGAIAAGTTLLAISAAPAHVLASTPLCSAPQVQSVSPQSATPGANTAVTVNGAGLGPGVSNCGLTLNVGGVDFSAQVISRTDSALQFHLTTPASGAVTVTVIDPTGGSNVSNADTVFVTTPTVGSLPPAPAVGQALSTTGSGLLLGGHGATPSVTVARTAGVCPTPAPSVSDTQVALPALSQYCDMSVTLHLQAYANTEHTVAGPAFDLPLGSVDVAASVAGGSAANAPAGSSVRISGSGFGTSGQATIAGAGAASSWTDTQVTVTLPDTAVSGAVVLTRAPDGRGIPVGSLGVGARVDTVSPSAAGVGDTVTVAGGGFGSTTGTIALGSTRMPVQTWSPTRIVAVVPAGAASGPMSISPTDTLPAASPPSLTIVPRILGVNPTHAAPGSVFEITGTSFGQPQPGDAVTVNGVAAQVTLWGDLQVLVSMPGGVRPGPATVSVTVPGAPSPVTISISVDVPSAAPASPGARPGPGLIPPKPGGPVVSSSSVPFQKPAKPPGPVDLTLTTPSTTADAGKDVPFTVTIVAFGKPVVGAPVEMLMVYEPGVDAKVTPDKAVTDGSGTVRGVVHLSGTPGDHIVLARSGIYSDEVRIVGRSVKGGATLASRIGQAAGDGAAVLAAPQRLVIVVATTLCVVFFVTGFVIQLKTAPGRGVAGEAVGNTSPRAAMRNPLAVIAGGAGAIAAALQVSAALAAAAVGRVVAALRRS